ncbi:putative sulfate transporter family protein [Erysiphe necator]|uniref:Putative sulfate transporter family protein n=1 Tax=Uncinula necator TaxID=52586 RepID=A0A0B1PE39_UNCNE|nr:putative sulfate transporter family protein [Erysiphe necator]
MDGEMTENGMGQRPRTMNSSDLRPSLTERTALLKRKIVWNGHNRFSRLETQQEAYMCEMKFRKFRKRIHKIIIRFKSTGCNIARLLSNPKTWNGEVIWKKAILAPIEVLPAVALGLLLNILDALSYGMILFPLGEPLFSKLGPAGISMFFVSCIVSQLVFSCGGSVFRGGVGSEMIEVVPFFHLMAGTILKEIGDTNPSAVIATTILTYAISSLLTGAVFFLIGYLKVGHMVGFIPRHILIGCIGGVGFFLMITGLEVTARLDKLEYSLLTLHRLFQPDTVSLWVIPLALAVLQISTESIIDFKYFLPAFVLTIPVVFYFIIACFSTLNVSNLRNDGWIFQSPEAGESWWYFYTLYNFRIIRWDSILKCVPAMFALTFFGILHVPINVPSLASAIGEDRIDLNSELLAHGASNALSGMFGSVQNYLVYTNSVIFIKSGGGSQLAGIMLAIATGIVMMMGSLIIGYIPIMMVGALMFILGIELLKEAVWDPRKKLKSLEYLTVVTIVIVMGIYDFVIGIFVGIALALVTLVFQTSQIPAVRAIYSGEVVGSTVHRSPIQHRYLKKVGGQICVVKLNGFLFFGTIANVEDRMRQIIEKDEFDRRPIRFLIFDLFHVTGLDFSAREAFGRINRFMCKKGIQIIMSGLNNRVELRLSLEAVDLCKDDKIQMFEDLNLALESCENVLLRTFHSNRDAQIELLKKTRGLDVPVQNSSDLYTSINQCNTPRGNQLIQVATNTLNQGLNEMRFFNIRGPLHIILQSFGALTILEDEFWYKAVPYFNRKDFIANTIVYQSGDQANDFFLLEQGIMYAEYDLPQGNFCEKIVACTTFGELPFFSDTTQTATVVAESDCATWVLDRENWISLQKLEPELAHELLRVVLKITSDRIKSITNYVLTTTS